MSMSHRIRPPTRLSRPDARSSARFSDSSPMCVYARAVLIFSCDILLSPESTRHEAVASIRTVVLSQLSIAFSNWSAFRSEQDLVSGPVTSIVRAREMFEPRSIVNRNFETPFKQFPQTVLKDSLPSAKALLELHFSSAVFWILLSYIDRDCERPKLHGQPASRLARPRIATGFFSIDGRRSVVCEQLGA